jgi:hypothetical protein
VKLKYRTYILAVVVLLLGLAALLVASLRNTNSGLSGRLPALVYPISESESKQMLRELGCTPEGFAVVTRLLFNPVAVLAMVILLSAAAVFGQAALTKRKLSMNMGNAVLAVTLLLAVFQWHASLEQEAAQRYEAEITNANAAESSPAVVQMLGRFYVGKTPGENERIRYIYIHLDNLEYALDRYRHGFASASTTARAVMTFAGHCQQPEFGTHARQQVAGYPQFVRTVVAGVLARGGAA